MPGQFGTSTPKLPGAYVNFAAAPQAAVPVSVGSLVALPITHDWGPFNTAVTVGSLSEFQKYYGLSTTTPGYIAAMQAFKGEGVAGRGGAGACLVYRTGGATAAKATRILTNTTPATALTLTARYEGVKGNTITVTVQDYAADSTQTELIVYVGGFEVERFRFLDADINGVAAQINASSGWLTAVANLNGVALTPVTTVTFAGGNDGTTLATGDWTNVMTALGAYRFGVFAPYDMTDPTVLAAMKTWSQSANSLGRRFMTVVGGAVNETYATAKTRALSLNDYNFSTVGIGSVQDTAILDVNNAPVVLSTSQFAPRVAGALANRGESMSLTFARFADIKLLQGASLQNIADAYDNGIMVLESDSNANPVRINKARTTYTTAIDAGHPVSIFSDPKFVRTMQNFEMEITEYAEATIIGQLAVNDQTRQSLVGEMKSRLRKREEAGIIRSGWTVVISNNPPPGPTDDFIKLDYSLTFGRSLEKLLNSITVG